MTREQVYNEDHYTPCMGLGHRNVEAFAQVWWYDPIFQGGSVGLCDVCARQLALGLISDVLAGGKSTLGSFIEDVVSGLVATGEIREANRNPWAHLAKLRKQRGAEG